MANYQTLSLPHTTVYAINALLELGQSEKNEPVSSATLAKRRRISKRFLLQVLRALVAEEILRSARGVTGGYSLNRPLDQITLLDVILAMEKTFNRSHQLSGFRSGVCEKIAHTLDEALAAQRHSLSRLTLAELVSVERNQVSARTALA